MASEASIPTKEELQGLPRWAQAAFAARCADRVRPLFSKHWPDAPASNLDRLNHAIDRTLLASVKFSNAIDYWDDDAADASPVVASVASAAASADAVLDVTSHAMHETYIGDSAEPAHSAARHSLEASARAGYEADQLLIAIRTDFELLRSLSQSESWTDESPVDTVLLGPLWPVGKPEGWPDEPKPERPEYLKIELVTPAGLTGEESDDLNRRVAAFFAELSALHIAMGGTGLRLVQHDSQETAPVEDRQPIGSETGPAEVCR
ncbi:MAG: hypothetical protein LAT64_13175 [Phycisphaerales bacterium]|nr:hypothetical protein [Planctomycetota bacterium]MCH8509706.1 hypothetical protein [Phycisphaerales bacterium]